MPPARPAATNSTAPKETERKTVFISHISLESKMARVLKQEIETAFTNTVKAFVSSSPELAAMGNWLQRLETELGESSVFLVLASQVSVGSTWVFFETGFARARQVHVIPICYPGQTPTTLPMPLALFDALKLSDPNFGKKLIDALRRKLDASSSRAYRYDGLKTGVRVALEDLVLKVDFLRLIKERHRAECTMPKLAEAVGQPEDVASEALSDLEDGDYVVSGGLGYLPLPGYSLSEKGKEALRRLTPSES